jgi:hypothetical protein
VTGSAAAPRYTRSDHLVGLVAEVERLASLVGTADPAARRRVAAARGDAAIHASLVLDGAPAAALPDQRTAEERLAARAPDGATRPAARAGAPRRGWLDTLRVLEDPADEELRALEVVGVARALAADAPADALFVDLAEALRELHGHLTRGLIDAERVGAPRTSDQAVHDGSVGRLLYATAAPAAVPGEVALLGGWLVAAGSREHALIVSGVVHLELLRIHPFDAANGRLARAAARLLLRARGLDPDGLAAPEPALARDPLGYHEEVARTLRRRDLTIWLERWGEAVSDGLRTAARDLALLPDAVPDRAARFVADRDDPAFTLADYRAQTPALPEPARADLAALLDAGRIRRRPGSRGLRFELVGD